VNNHPVGKPAQSGHPGLSAFSSRLLRLGKKRWKIATAFGGIGWSLKHLFHLFPKNCSHVMHLKQQLLKTQHPEFASYVHTLGDQKIKSFGMNLSTKMNKHFAFKILKYSICAFQVSLLSVHWYTLYICTLRMNVQVIRKVQIVLIWCFCGSRVRPGKSLYYVCSIIQLLKWIELVEKKGMRCHRCDWHDCIAWLTKENCARFIHNWGTYIYVQGQSDKWGILTRVARRYICAPKIPVLVYFGRPRNGKLRSFGMFYRQVFYRTTYARFCGYLVDFSDFGIMY
jgi:hypothetical protein